ncbi:SIS domain-containing protein [Tomitella gaofuii]|uniref:D-sedoheptulose-7-phosphate isomerase n=1 Tax=Tomitella gaofuii TaxID=2760083 RepID=UPI001F36180F|nr:SIS domain-containing protein [Tomitella gaofuii]
MIDRWGRRLAGAFDADGRLLCCGNGGSAAQAQHLTAELVGKFEAERRPLSAIALHSESSSVTALINDYSPSEMYARQVRAHGRRGDVLLCLSTSGRSANVVAAAKEAQAMGVDAWALTGPEPNPLAALCDAAITVDAPLVSTVQEAHLVVIHALCAAIDRAFDADHGAAVDGAGGAR